MNGASVFLLTTAITLAVYVNTASESIAGGDSGELVAEGCALGTAHPPGYPLYTLIIYAVTTLGKSLYPELTPAYLANVTSCVFGALSSGLISLVVYMLTKKRGQKSAALGQLDLLTASRCSAALSAGLMCSFSPLMWQYNKEAEVFALHNFFVSLIVYVLACHVARPSSTPLIYLGALLCGLALTNQHTSILLIIPVAGYVLFCGANDGPLMLTKPKVLVISALSFVVGISLYALLSYCAIEFPHRGSWGNVTTFSGFLHHFLRRDYGSLRLYSGSDAGSEGMAMRTFGWAFDFISHQLGYTSLFVGSLFGFVLGCCTFGKKTRKTKSVSHERATATDIGALNAVWRTILLALVFYLAVFHSLSNLPLSNPLLYGIHQVSDTLCLMLRKLVMQLISGHAFDQKRFWMHPNIFCFILIGIGLEKSIVIASRRVPSRLAALASVTLLLPIVSFRQNISMSDQSDNNYFQKYALSILETLPKDSLLIINYDQQWTSIRYHQECEGARKDITSINLSMMTYPWWESKQSLYGDLVSFPGTHYTKANTLAWQAGAFTFQEFIDANVANFGANIFFGGRLNFEDHASNEKYEEEPFGLVRRIQSRAPMARSSESYRSESLRTWRTVAGHLASDLPPEAKYPTTTWEWTIRREWFDHMVSRSTYLLDLALTENDDSSRIKPGLLLPSIAEAAAWLELACSLDSENVSRKSSMKKNLGLAYMNIVRSKEIAFPSVEDIFPESNGTASGKQNWFNGDGDWKEWATIRWREEWETFLDLESSKDEPGYSQIKTIFEAVMKSSHEKSYSRL
ncbi:hypothetical protein ACHAWF_012162 [Thalassiosira exigua]